MFMYRFDGVFLFENDLLCVLVYYVGLRDDYGLKESVRCYLDVLRAV